jgi:hypothetical protein
MIVFGRDKFTGRLAVVCLAAAAACSSATAAGQMKINVAAGATHKFLGLGASTNNKDSYQQLDPATRRQIANLLWKDTDFRVLRLWGYSSMDDGGKTFADHYKMYYEDVKAVQDSLIVLLGPTGTIGDLQSR